MPLHVNVARKRLACQYHRCNRPFLLDIDANRFISVRDAKDSISKSDFLSAEQLYFASPSSMSTYVPLPYAIQPKSKNSNMCRLSRKLQQVENEPDAYCFCGPASANHACRKHHYILL